MSQNSQSYNAAVKRLTLKLKSLNPLRNRLSKDQREIVRYFADRVEVADLRQMKEVKVEESNEAPKDSIKY